MSYCLGMMADLVEDTTASCASPTPFITLHPHAPPSRFQAVLAEFDGLITTLGTHPPASQATAARTRSQLRLFLEQLTALLDMLVPLLSELGRGLHFKNLASSDCTQGAHLF
ncbi:MAG: hypothetical protein WDW38_008305 [Sanguina aurantia]